MEELALRGVDVFRLEGIVVTQLPCLEADHAAARVGEREEEAAAEVVVAAAADEPGSRELGPGEALLLRLAGQRRRERREPEPELPARLLAEPAPRQILPCGSARLRVPEVALVERGGLLEQGVEPVAPLPVGVGLR